MQLWALLTYQEYQYLGENPKKIAVVVASFLRKSMDSRVFGSVAHSHKHHFNTAAKLLL